MKAGKYMGVMKLTKIIEQIEGYRPYNEQEENDQRITINCLKRFDDILTRENDLIHMTASGFVVNSSRDQVLMVYHNIYNSWSWTGGHADGEADLVQVALKEVWEETGVQSLRLVTQDILSLDIISVLGHVKKGRYVSPHLHISVSYLMEADEWSELTVKPDENSAVKWLPIQEVEASSSEAHMKIIYHKIISKINTLNLETPKP